MEPTPVVDGKFIEIDCLLISEADFWDALLRVWYMHQIIARLFFF